MKRSSTIVPASRCEVEAGTFMSPFAAGRRVMSPELFHGERATFQPAILQRRSGRRPPCLACVERIEHPLHQEGLASFSEAGRAVNPDQSSADKKMETDEMGKRVARQSKDDHLRRISAKNQAACPTGC